MTLVFVAGAFFMMVCVPVLAFNAPVIVILLVLGERVKLLQRRALLAVGFGAVAAYEFYRLWFWDVWPPPQGPPARYYLTTILPWSLVFAAAGWFLGSTLKLKTRNYELESISKSK